MDNGLFPQTRWIGSDVDAVAASAFGGYFIKSFASKYTHSAHDELF